MESAREQALRQELEAVRRELEKWHREAIAQRELAHARQAAAQAYEQEAETLRLAQDQLGRRLEQADKPPVRPDPATDLAQQKAKLQRDFDARRRQLEADFEILAVQYKRALADLEAAYGNRPLMSGKDKAKQPAMQGQPPSSADKVDRILERLDRLERLVDRLVLDRPPAKQGK
jgi:hypothetical protein